MRKSQISLQGLIRRFLSKTLITWVLVVFESVSFVLMPMAIGWAVDDFLVGSTKGLLSFSGICLMMLILGSLRRLFDTRAYGAIFMDVAKDLIQRERQNHSGVSKTTARVNLFAEFIQFLEMSIPGIIQEFINLFGTLIIILFIDIKVFIACFTVVMLTTCIYILSQGKIFFYNQGWNDEKERQVDVIESDNSNMLKTHLKILVDWQIKLSDLETYNFSVVWVVLSFLMVFTIINVASSDTVTFGQIVSAVMYVFGFAGSLMLFPQYYQQLIRLQEITMRLESENS